MIIDVPFGVQKPQLTIPDDRYQIDLSDDFEFKVSHENYSGGYHGCLLYLRGSYEQFINDYDYQYVYYYQNQFSVSRISDTSNNSSTVIRSQCVIVKNLQTVCDENYNIIGSLDVLQGYSKTFIIKKLFQISEPKNRFSSGKFGIYYYKHKDFYLVPALCLKTNKPCIYDKINKYKYYFENDQDTILTLE